MTDRSLAALFLSAIALGVALASPSWAGSSGSAGGELTLVERQVVSGSTATVVTFSGLDGDSDNLYLLSWQLQAATSGSSSLDIEFNGITTDSLEDSEELSASAATAGAATVTTALRLSQGPDADLDSVGHAWIHADSAHVRLVLAQHIRELAADNGAGYWRACMWDDESTNITSIEVQATIAGGITVGSIFTLFKLSSAGD